MVIDIVIVNWNSGSYLKDCIDSILQLPDYKHVQTIFVVDNNSSDNSLEVIRDSDKIVIIQNETNRGFAAACNQGFKRCSSPYILLLNPDTKLLPNVLKEGLDFMNSHEDVSIMGCQMLDDDGKISPSCSRFPTPGRYWNDALGLSKLLPKVFKPPLIMTDWDHKTSRFVDQVMGAFMLFRSDLFAEIGYFDEQFFVYMEELDFSKRLSDAGGKSFFNAEIKIYHAGEGTTERVKSYRLYLSIQSRLKYARKHFSRFGYLSVKFSSLAVEPFTRSFLLLFSGSFRELPQVWRAFRLLYKNPENRTTVPFDTVERSQIS